MIGTQASGLTNGYEHFVIRRSEEQRVTSADAVVDGLAWEMKAPTADNLKAVERNLKRGRWQSESIIFDCRRMKKVPDAAIEREIRKQAFAIPGSRGYAT